MDALSRSAKDNPASIIRLIIIMISPTINIVFLPNLFIINPAKKGEINKAPPTPQDIYNPSLNLLCVGLLDFTKMFVE